MPLKAEDKWDAIKQMSSYLIRSNHINNLTAEQLHAIVEEREREFPTAIGEHIAVPHARISGNEKLMGVIGICQKPIEFGSFDKKPVDIIILVATPEDKPDLHIKLLAAIARIFSNQEIHKKIIEAHSPAEVYDILQGQEVRSLNSYLIQN